MRHDDDDDDDDRRVRCLRSGEGKCLHHYLHHYLYCNGRFLPFTYQERRSFVDSDPPSRSSWIFYTRPPQTKQDILRVCYKLKQKKYITGLSLEAWLKTFQSIVVPTSSIPNAYDGQTMATMVNTN